MLKDIERQKVRKRAEEGPVELPPDMQHNNAPAEQPAAPEEPPPPPPPPVQE